MLDISCNIFTEDFELFKNIVNQGIDSYLTMFGKSKFYRRKDRFFFDFDESEIEILLRRLSNENTEIADSWIDDILQYHYGIKTI